MFKGEKGARSVIRKIILLWMAGMVLTTSGCAQSKGTGITSDADNGNTAAVSNNQDGTKDSDSQGSNADATESKNGDDGSPDVNGNVENGGGAEDGDKNSENDNQNETQVALSEEELTAPIEYSFQKHPCSLIDGETELAISNYTTIELDKSDREKFGKLKDILDDFGKNGEKEVDTFFESSADEIREMFNNGIGIGYEADKFFAPVRADGRVFSFVITNYTFLAGAHGFTDYSNYNYDPVTGEEIKFTDVVKDTDKLPDIIVDELEKQNEDLVEYFENGPEDKENLRAGIPDRLSNNAAALSWVLDYDGVWFYFEDYAMGTYVAGSRNVKVRFADYPDLFTDTYNNYTDGKLPQIKAVAKELKDAENRITDASSIGSVKLNAGTGNGESDYGYDSVNPETGNPWWEDAIVKNPGWSAWVKDGIDTDPGTPSFELLSVTEKTSDWLDEDKWSAENGIPLPERFPYSDGTYSYDVNDGTEAGTLVLTVTNDVNDSLQGNYNFDEFLDPPDKGEDLFADFAQPEIRYALLKDDILYVAIGHRTYASSSPHTSYLVAYDTLSGETLWKSEDQVCGSNNFIIEGDSIICGYGFTAEPDYIYIINRTNGKTQKQIKVKSAPYYFIPQDNYLYVLTYNTEYQYVFK